MRAHHRDENHPQYLLPRDGATECKVELTPELAEEWLADTCREDFNEDTVAEFAALMRDKHFRRGSPMCRKGGRLEDGHHRARAVVESGCSIWVRLVEF